MSQCQIMTSSIRYTFYICCMSIAVIAPGNDRSKWIEYFNKADSSIKVEIWPEIEEPEKVQCALVWKHPPGELLKYPNLKFIACMGAGVDHIIRDPNLPDVPITKVVDDQLSKDMSNYVIQGVLNHQRHFVQHIESRKKGEWLKGHRYPEKMRIGILGLGVLGQDVAEKLAFLGFEVFGFSQTEKHVEGVKSFFGSVGESDEFLKSINVLVCMVPLVKKTRGILNIDLFRKLNKGTHLINVARGEHIVDEDLITAIDEEFISGALLDVFHKEPLPSEHPFWSREEIMITPHNASITDPKSVAKQIADNYNKIGNSEPFDFVIDRERGY